MPDLRIFSYLPNPRLSKATIAARFSGAELEIVGAKPGDLAGWLWDYEARPLQDADRSAARENARTAQQGFQGTLYKTDAFLAAHPFGEVPAAFGDDGAVGVFESNAIMRAAARLGPRAGGLCGDGPLLQSRVDGFLDRSLVFAREVQRYLLADRQHFPPDRHADMAAALLSYLDGIERALRGSRFVAGDTLSLADITFACELCLLSNEHFMRAALEAAGLAPLVPRLGEYERCTAHLIALAGDERFREDLGKYLDRLLAALQA